MQLTVLGRVWVVIPRAMAKIRLETTPDITQIRVILI
jgi:hypothetical protein